MMIILVTVVTITTVISSRVKIYILLDVLLCSIAEYFYELCRILASP